MPAPFLRLICVHPVASDSNVSFDFVVAAQYELAITGAGVYAASMIACSNSSARFGGGVRLDASGRGCGPGEDRARRGLQRRRPVGDVRRRRRLPHRHGRRGRDLPPRGPEQECGAYPGQAYDGLSESLMPTRGASGGGCGVPAPCPDLVGPEDDMVAPSSGGGLIWLSARNFTMSDDVQVLAPGTAGKVKPYRGQEKVSGAGAGGQILLYASNFVSMEATVVLDVSGGTIQCTKSMVGGGGGGGFIGLQYGSGDVPLSPSVFHSLLPKYNGGGMLSDCEGFVPPNGLNLTFGKAGKALSLTDPAARTACCASSAPLAGTPLAATRSAWTVTISLRRQYSGYTTEGWPNATCPFKCGP
ncbi:unnamed protein product [Prorocentrum cordatum]|uniref:Altered inheritance of mitochondria protein 24, mitochondrial n=1 Tax=Prorocentrum cordatum TaxID=2364126 RepID=A0ABN9X3X8_9DINO|nr:unnamed protein product [Polarella glacialis]